MANQTTFPGDVLANGNLAGQTLTLTSPSVTDAMCVASMGLQASKQQHQHEQVYSQPGAQNAAVERKVVHVVCGTTGVITDFKVGARVAATGNATVTIDFQKNGSSILSATITLDSTTAAYILKAGTLSAGTLAAGDVLEVVVSAVNAGTGTLPQGLFARVNLREDPQ